MLKKFVIALVVLALAAIGFRIIFGGSASATEVECVPSEGQHYSWTGGRLDVDNPPSEVPPSANWQSNTNQEPHENGNGNPATWVNDNLHYTANSNGHASWFYYVPPVICDDEPEVPERPDNIVSKTSETYYECGNDFQTVRVMTEIQTWLLSEDGTEWVPGPSIHPKPVETTVPHEVIPCIVDNPEEPEKPTKTVTKTVPKKAQAPAKKAPVEVPLYVAAGM